MNNSNKSPARLWPLFLITIGLVATPASAQVFLGSDNFNDNTLTLQGASNQAQGQWRGSGAAPGSSAFSETNQRLEYTANAGYTTVDNLIWVSPSTSIVGAPSGTNLGIGGLGLSSGNPYNSSWSSQLTVTNTATGGASAGYEFYTYTAAGYYNAFYGIYLDTALGGNSVLFQWGKNIGGSSLNFQRSTSTFAATSTTDVILRMDYDGASKVMSGSYSFDNGVSFLSAGSFILNGAQAGVEVPYNNGIGLELIGNPYGGAGITGGQITFDNLSVSAVPEPSTYALLSGVCALGLAFWRRRVVGKAR